MQVGATKQLRRVDTSGIPGVGTLGGIQCSVKEIHKAPPARREGTLRSGMRSGATGMGYAEILQQCTTRTEFRKTLSSHPSER